MGNTIIVRCSWHYQPFISEVRLRELAGLEYLW
uniref:Uncharacterized protein n=2 Tax=Caudoviricetes TaxID=2731619 RepID=A0AAU8B0Q7_9CAUD|nr:MAG TPA: hypothetical protein [CrAss-like virus sp. ctDAq1]